METKSRITYFVQEIIIVVAGVLIAFSINNYKDKLDNEAYIQKTLVAIEREVSLNRSSLDTILSRHTEAIESLEDSLIESDIALLEMIQNLGGFQAASLKNISLRFFISHKAELLDFQLVSQLQSIENKTSTLSSKINRLADFAYANMSDRKAETKKNFTYMLLDVIESEEALLRAYEAFLENNEETLRQQR